MSSHKTIIFLLIILHSIRLCASDHQHVDDHVHSDSDIQWSQILDVEQFWQDYADSKGGLTWGIAHEYPDYSLLKEGDTILIELPQGRCLMEFFHSRWRRANDVWRWHQSFNDYDGCPYVFD